MPVGSPKCTRPIGSDCRQANGKSGFRCYTFGFSQNKQKAEVSHLTCISLYSPEKGLEDLTIRCVEANKELIKSVAVNSPEYNSFITKLKEDLNHFERKLISSKEQEQMAFRDYCSKQVSINVNIQKSECKALLGLIDELREKISIFVALPESMEQESAPEDGKKDGSV